MVPVAVAVMESEASVMDPVGAGWVPSGGVGVGPTGVVVEGELDEPQPGRREEAARASAP